MRFKYKSYPITPNPAFPGQTTIWQPVLHVRLANVKKHTSSTTFEAWVDSGSPYCYFHSQIGRAIGLDVEKGAKSSLGGIIGGPREDAFFHNVGIYVGVNLIRVRAGFCDRLAVGGILGRMGFFDNFVVTFDQSATPPVIELVRIP